MFDEILPNIFKIQVPLPDNPLKALNSYVIKDNERNLIVDTGMNREECLNVLQSSLKKLNVDLRKTDFFITHQHADHMGLVSTLATDSSTIYFNQPDLDLINSVDYLENLFNFVSMSGFPKNKIQDIFEQHPGYVYNPIDTSSFTILKEGDIVTVGDYIFQCVETPGHTNGHMCLYENNKKILISGDHILNDITPNIILRSYEMNPLDEYLSSLDKIYELDIEMVLPAHKDIFTDCKSRIDQIKHHHQIRCDEIISILKQRSADAFSVASLMTWELSYDSWEQFPTPQKWFATGEANAHLKHLENKGLLKREILDKKIQYSLI
ncbi:MAG: MBL fold metallo-hydrolase [Spirochaetota bacterium]|nr:MBL fold metallo-hydrolase [Spirochaetota bacterium]